MGDRSNVFIIERFDPDGLAVGVYLYSHWGGSAFHDAALAALATSEAKGRWDDPHYLTAIVAKTPEVASQLSGIGAMRDDNEHPILVVDCVNGNIGFREEGAERDPMNRDQPHTWPMADIGDV